MSDDQMILPVLPQEVWSIVLRKLDHQSLINAIRLNSLWLSVCCGDPKLRKNVQIGINDYLEHTQTDLEVYLIQNIPLRRLFPHEIESLLVTWGPYSEFHKVARRLGTHLQAKRKALDNFIEEKNVNLGLDPENNLYAYVEDCRKEIDKYLLEGQNSINAYLASSRRRIDAYLRKNRRERRSSI